MKLRIKPKKYCVGGYREIEYEVQIIRKFMFIPYWSSLYTFSELYSAVNLCNDLEYQYKENGIKIV